MVTARRRFAAAEPLPAGLTPERLDQLIGGQTSADFQLVWRRLQKAMEEHVLKANLKRNFGYPTGGKRGPDSNARKGTSTIGLLTECDPVAPEVTRNRAAGLSPQWAANRRPPLAGLPRNDAHASWPAA